MHSINWRETRRFILMKMCELNENALQTRHVAFKSKIQWYLAKQMTKVSNRIQTNFTICHERCKDIEISLISILIATISNFISETRHERLCTLFDFSGYETCMIVAMFNK